MKKMLIAVITLIFCVLSLYSAEVMMVFPADKDVNVPLDTEVSATFDNEITAFDFLGITIMPKVGNVSVYVEEDTRLVIYHDDFEPYTTYTIRIPYGAITEYNNFGFSWSFTTGNYTDLSIINEDEE